MYEVELPDGTIIEVPDDMPQSEAKQRILKSFPQYADKQSIFRQVADVPLGIAQGAVSTTRMLANMFGAGSGASQTLKGAEDYIADFMSAQSKSDAQEMARIQKEAEDKGAWEQVKAGLKAFSVAPIDTLSSAAGSAVPFVLGSLGAAAAGAPVGIGTGIGALLSAGAGAGTIKGSIYEATKQALVEAGASPQDAEKRAQTAQEYGGKNLDQILLGTVLGGVAGYGPLEKGAARILSGKILGKAAAEESGEAATKGAIRQRVEAGAMEALPEALQAGQEQVAANLALQREGMDAPTFRGAFSAAALEGIAGAGLGAAVGGHPQSENLRQAAERLQAEISSLRAQEQTEQTQQALAEKEQQMVGLQSAMTAAVSNEARQPRRGVSPELGQLMETNREQQGIAGILAGQKTKGFAGTLSPGITSSTDSLAEFNQLLVPTVSPYAQGLESALTAAETSSRVNKATREPSLAPSQQIMGQGSRMPFPTGVSSAAGLPAKKSLRIEPFTLDALAEIPWEAKSFTEVGKPMDKATGSSRIVDLAGRKIVLADVNGTQVPFYLSSGAGGKAKVQAGKWYPFFGVGADGWINKGSQDQIVSYYKNQALADMAKQLDENIGDIRDDRTIPAVGATGRHIDTINGGMVPAENGRADTVERLQENVWSLLGKVGQGPLQMPATPRGATEVPFSKPAEIDLDKERLADLQKGVLAAEKQRRSIVRNSHKLWATLRNKLDRYSVTDISPDKSYSALLNKERGRDLSSLVADGEVDAFLPPRMRSTSEFFDEIDATNYIKDLLATSKTHLEYERNIQLRALTDSIDEMTSEINALVNDNEANQLLQQAYDEQRRIDQEADAAESKRTDSDTGKSTDTTGKPASPEVAKELTERQKLIIQKTQELQKVLQKMLGQMGMRDVALKITADLTDADGEYSSKLIRLAFDAANPLQTMRHEAIHALKALGFFSPKQWDTLTQMAKDTWIPRLKTVDINQQPLAEGETSRYDAYVNLFTSENKTSAQIEEALLEEAIADAFGEFDATSTPPGLLAAIVKRMRNLFAALKATFSGDEDVEQIFRKIERGGMTQENAWKASTEEKKKAISYAEDNGIDPYISEGRLDLPTKFSLKLKEKKFKDGTSYGSAPIINIPLNADGTVTVYYHTTKDKAITINANKVIPAEGRNRIYLTNESSGAKILGGRGNFDQTLDGSTVLLHIPPSLLQLDQSYPDGRKDFFVPLAQGEFFNRKMQAASIQAERTKAITDVFSYREHEDRIARAVLDYKRLNKKEKEQSLAQAKALLKKEHNVGTLLTENGKLEKTRMGGLQYEGSPIDSMGLGLAAAQQISGKVSSCPNAAICEGLCLGETSGGNFVYGGAAQEDVEDIAKSAFRAGPRMMQYLKTEALIIHPEEFAVVLQSEIEALQEWDQKATIKKKNKSTGKMDDVEKDIYQSAVRLNVTSDFRGEMWRGIIENNPNVIFYDYTKLVGNGPIGPNHYLTYSSTGFGQVVDGDQVFFQTKSGKYNHNWAQIRNLLNSGKNAAMAFSSKSSLPKFLRDEETGVTYKVLDGDEYDARFLDEASPLKQDSPYGVIVGLRNKASNLFEKTATKKTKGFFAQYNPKTDGDTVTVPTQTAFGAPPYQAPGKVIPIAKKSLRAPQTEAFKQWFGDSKIVDANGEPLVVYHYTDTPEDFSRFGTKDNNELGSHFGTTEQIVDLDEKGGYESAPRVMPVYLSIKNPLRLIDDGGFQPSRVMRQLDEKGLLTERQYNSLAGMSPQKANAKIRELLTKAGYDGIVYVNRREGYGRDPKVWADASFFGSRWSDAKWLENHPEGKDSYIAFQPPQIKSAIGNIGTYSPTNPDIRKSLRTAPTSEAFKQWFGDSKIVGKDGKPLVMYHGTARDINVFKPKQANAIFLTGDKEFAEGFASMSLDWVARNYKDMLTPNQLVEARAFAERLGRQTYSRNPKLVEQVTKDLRQGKDTEDATDLIATAVKQMLDKTKRVMEVYVRAEKPFDYDNPDHIKQVADLLPATVRAEVAFSDEPGISYTKLDAIEKLKTGEWDIVESKPVQKAIRELGFDSFYTQEGGEKNIAVYNSNQIKSATNNEGAYDINNPDIRKSLRSPIGLYSELETKIEGISSKQAPAAQWKTMINALPKKGVKPEEIEWSGVNDWLDAQGGKVSKDDLLNYLKEGGVRVEETVLGSNYDDAFGIFEEYMEPDGTWTQTDDLAMYYKTREEAEKAITPELVASSKQWAKDTPVRLVVSVVKDVNFGGETRYHRYSLPGGKNYREVLLKIPSDAPNPSNMARMYAGSQRMGLVGLPDEAVPAVAERLAERAGVDVSDMTAAINLVRGKTQEGYITPHWKQQNVLAHIRMNDRTDADGKKVLFVEEIQSDWGQAGKKNGFGKRAYAYTAVPPPEGDRFAKWHIFQDGKPIGWVDGPTEQKALAQAKQMFGETFEGPPVAPFVSAKKFAVFTNGKELTRTDQDGKEIKQRYDSLETAEAAAKKVDGEARSLGAQANTEGWLNLALKRIMVMAAEGGYDKVAFTTGAQNAQRFALDEQLSEFAYEPIGNGKYEITALDLQGREVMSEDEIDLARIEELVGKEMAEKVSRDEGERDDSGYREWRYLRGDNLKVEAKGMRTFYDTIVPTALKKLLPKVDGEPMGRVTLVANDNVRKVRDDDGTFAIEEKKYDEYGESYFEPIAYNLSEQEVNARLKSDARMQQPGFDVTPSMKQKVETTGLPKFSLRGTPAKAMPIISQAAEDAVTRTTKERDEKSFIRNILDAISPKNFTSFRSEFLNRYNGLSLVDKRRVQKMGGAAAMADVSAESAALLSDVGAGITAAVFGVDDKVGGAPVYAKTYYVVKNDQVLPARYKTEAEAKKAAGPTGSVRSGGHTTVSNFNNTVKGPLAIFAPLAAYNNPRVYQHYQFWAAVKRGIRFTAEGREQLLTQNDVNLAKEYERAYPEFKSIQEEWIKYNNQLVQYMVDTGVLSKERAKIYTEHSDYIPFYRQIEGSDKAVGPSVFSAISGVKPPKMAKGSTAVLDDFLETIVRNSQSAIQAGIKNLAAQKAVEAAMDVGIATKLPTSSGLPNVVVVHENGVPTYYNCEDALFVNAVKSLGMSEIPFLNILAAPANLLREMVTKEPTFLLANMLRDSLSAYVTSGTNMTPVLDTFKNFGKALAGKSPEFAALTKSGILGGYEFTKGVDMGGRKFGEMLKKKADVKPNGLFPNVVGYGKSFWGVLEKGSSASDAATRMEIYKRTLAETGNETEAIFRSLEVMNFNRKGRNALVRVFTAMAPFINARMQGLDILYRTALEPSMPGQTVSARQRQLQRSFFLRGAMMAGLSCLYWLLVHDDDDYKKQEQETKDNNWLIPGVGVRMPTPFEVGFFFKTVPERIMALAFGDDSMKDFRESMTRGVVSTLKVVPIPLLVLPVMENLFNFSTFTGRPIVGPGTADLEPGYQVNANTAQIIADLGQELNISPIKIEHAIQGHTGQMGMYMVSLIDAMWNANNPIQKPAKQFYQLPMIKRFAMDPDARGKLTQFYELKNDVDTVVRTSNDMERSGRFDELDEYQKGKMALLDNKEYVLAIERSLSDIRDQKKEILSSDDSPEDKRDALLELQRMENDLVDNIQEIRKEAYGPD